MRLHYLFWQCSVNCYDENEVLDDSEIDDEDYDFEQEAHQDPASAIAVGIHPSDQVVHEEILTDSDEEF